MKLRHLASTFALFLLSAFLALPITGCATVAAALPDVITAVMDGTQILDAIETFVNTYFLGHPDAAAQTKVNEAIAKARTALNVALRAAQGANGLENDQVDAAFKDFEDAYLALLQLCQPYGVKAAPMPDMRLATAPGALSVPQPLAFKLTAKKGK